MLWFTATTPPTAAPSIVQEKILALLKVSQSSLALIPCSCCVSGCHRHWQPSRSRPARQRLCRRLLRHKLLIRAQGQGMRGRVQALCRIPSARRASDGLRPPAKPQSDGRVSAELSAPCPVSESSVSGFVPAPPRAAPRFGAPQRVCGAPSDSRRKPLRCAPHFSALHSSAIPGRQRGWSGGGQRFAAEAPGGCAAATPVRQPLRFGAT